MATACGVNSGVRLPNHYTHAKLERVLPITSKDIHCFIVATDSCANTGDGGVFMLISVYSSELSVGVRGSGFFGIVFDDVGLYFLFYNVLRFRAIQSVS